MICNKKKLSGRDVISALAAVKEFEIDYDERFAFKPFDYPVPDGTS